ncbi:hypothetical protein IC229_01205 [Spirosoma sp. BT702]|uniref:Uncharacterized protein n=1 Tax=Spirosoma profusum TaxID=2771354 RepID=A0A926XSM8_9BACT|nr:hypothetical protein [Spirosoma profusum]MBD2699233.1 hypothetical protein [Spirosoma profusum]
MDDFDRRTFTSLMNAVVMKCFGHPLESPLSEPESKHLSNIIEERTGLVIGWRSLKNYATFVLNPIAEKQENPSTATFDTLSRYVFDAPATSEADRKKTGEHFPYWFRYRDQNLVSPKHERATSQSAKNDTVWYVVALVVIGMVLGFLFLQQTNLEQIQDDFRAVDEASLTRNGWFLKDKNATYWDKRGQNAGFLTLFTLQGDNWPKAGETPRVQNLLLRPIQSECFRTEVHFNNFVPGGNWQQAGILLLEDTLFTRKSIRLSLAYNNFFGGLKQPAEILIQATASYGKGDRNLEEFIHQHLFRIGNVNDQRIAVTNL